jgi:ethanolamine ammonia-lyase small subunit
VTADPWGFLRSLTHARIALGRAGHSIPTRELLDFRLAHSRARDSVWREVDFGKVRGELEILIRDGQVAAEGITGISTERLTKILTEILAEIPGVTSRCAGKQEFLLNPDRGRLLSPESETALVKIAQKNRRNGDGPDCVLVIADGLSADAVQSNAVDFARAFIAGMNAVNLSLGPVVLARYARVALGDEIGKALKARSVLMLIGERPGLASSDSLSVYFTYSPDSSRTDANRNCISNIHASGLSPAIAARMSVFLAQASIQRQLSGVDLKLEYDGIHSLQV